MMYDYLCNGCDKTKYNIAMICDFFYPNIGGVENHVFALSQCLIKLGHRVIVITHCYGDKSERQGVRYLSSGLKVYYLPMRIFYSQTVFITLLGTLPIFREIILREKIDIVHGHSLFSPLSHEGVAHGKSLGCATVFTEHSLHRFHTIESIIVNKCAEGNSSNIDQMISVSHTAKENVVLRSKLNPERVFVIPNAVDSFSFKPDFSCRDLNYITIVIASRLVHRKGIDLLVSIIPRLCWSFPELRFFVGGEGPKVLELEELRERFQLHSRVKLFGCLRQNDVRELLVQGDIYINTSLTESFCIAIIEAASCGLFVISTAVGGIPEVLPNDFIRYSSANAEDLASTVSETINLVHKFRRISMLNEMNKTSSDSTLITMPKDSRPYNSRCQFSLSGNNTSKQNDEDVFANCQTITEHGWHLHHWVHHTYSWTQVAERTVKVYDAAAARHSPTFTERLKRYYELGPFTGKLVVFGAILHWLLLAFLSWYRPIKIYDIVPTSCVRNSDQKTNLQEDAVEVCHTEQSTSDSITNCQNVLDCVDKEINSLIRNDLFLFDLIKDKNSSSLPTNTEVCNAIGISVGQSMQLTLLRGDGARIPLIVPTSARVLELRKIVQDAIITYLKSQKYDNLLIQRIGWRSVWRTKCLATINPQKTLPPDGFPSVLFRLDVLTNKLQDCYNVRNGTLITFVRKLKRK